MVVSVKVHFLGKPLEEVRQGMIQAAMSLSKNPNTVSVTLEHESKNVLVAVFRMKNEAQYKAIEKVWPNFAIATQSRTEMTVWFEQEKAYDLHTYRRCI
jgi:hypothetical protein